MRNLSCFTTLLFAVAGLATSSVLSPASAQASHDHAQAMPAGRPSDLTIPAPELNAIRTATAKYRDIKVALADGYIRDPANMCVTSAMEGAPRQLGAMGVHYFRPDLLAIQGETPRVHGSGTHTDFMTPGVLIYEPQADGSQKLVAIENLVWAGAWEATHKDPPAFHGYQYYHMQDNPLTAADEAHGFEPHYELHFWLYQDNPSGMFSPFNPTVTCEYHKQ